MSQQEFHITVMLEEEFIKRPAKPTYPITDNRFVYRNSAQTNVQDTWKRFGWQPKEQANEHQL